MAILHGITEDEVEDFVLRRHPRLRRNLKNARAAYRRAGGISLDRMIARLERKRAKA